MVDKDTILSELEEFVLRLPECAVKALDRYRKTEAGFIEPEPRTLTAVLHEHFTSEVLAEFEDKSVSIECLRLNGSRMLRINRRYVVRFHKALDHYDYSRNGTYATDDFDAQLFDEAESRANLVVLFDLCGIGQDAELRLFLRPAGRKDVSPDWVFDISQCSVGKVEGIFDQLAFEDEVRNPFRRKALSKEVRSGTDNEETSIDNN